MCVREEAIIILVDTSKKLNRHTVAQAASEIVPDENGYTRPSKSQLKRDSTALQELGAALVELSNERLKRIEMPDNLRSAVDEAKRINKHEARRRQLQYIGKLMRSVDVEPIQQALDEVAGISASANERMHRLERLRERLLDDEAAALAEITQAHPHADLQHLRQLRRNALKEREQAKPPRAFREIFRILKSLEEEAS